MPYSYFLAWLSSGTLINFWYDYEWKHDLKTEGDLKNEDDVKNEGELKED